MRVLLNEIRTAWPGEKQRTFYMGMKYALILPQESLLLLHRKEVLSPLLVEQNVVHC
jgi:hypothetical protein